MLNTLKWNFVYRNSIDKQWFYTTYIEFIQINCNFQKKTIKKGKGKKWYRDGHNAAFYFIVESANGCCSDNNHVRQGKGRGLYQTVFKSRNKHYHKKARG